MKHWQIHDGDVWYLPEISFPYVEEIKNRVKAIPGAAWKPSKHRWTVPYEMLNTVEKYFPGWKCDDLRKQGTHYAAAKSFDLPNLHPFQRKSCLEALMQREPIRWIFRDDTGLGKGVQAIACCREKAYARVLILTPAMMRQTWRDEVLAWWPEAGNRVEKIGREYLIGGGVRISSPGMLSKMQGSQWDCIILDEAHMYKNPQGSQSQNLRGLLASSPNCDIYALTATFMPNKPMDAWNVMDLLYPGRYGEIQKNGGVSYAFKNRYTNVSLSDDGYPIYEGTRNEAEFAMRLRCISSYNSKSDPEVARFLPVLSVDTLRVQPEQAPTIAVTSVRDIRSILEECGSLKSRNVISWAGEGGRSNHFAILTHRKGLSKTLATGLQEIADVTGATLVRLDGDLGVEEREKLLNHAKAADKAIVVATMHCIGIGIDLTWCREVLFAELYWRPATVIQALGRFSRLSGSEASAAYFLVLEGTLDEIVAERLQEKLEDINALSCGSKASEQMLESLSADDDEAFEASLLAAVRSGEEDAYA